MILPIINVLIALITLGLTYYNLKVVTNEHIGKRKVKIFISAINTTVFRDGDIKKIEIPIENIGINELIDTDVQIKYSYAKDQTFHIGTIKSNEKKIFMFKIDEIIEKHKKSKNKETEIEILLAIGYFNKHFNKYVIENKSLCLVVQNHYSVDDLLILKTNHLYIESKKLNEYKS